MGCLIVEEGIIVNGLEQHDAKVTQVVVWLCCEIWFGFWGEREKKERKKRGNIISNQVVIRLTIINRLY